MSNCTQIGSLNQRNLKKKEKEKTNVKQKNRCAITTSLLICPFLFTFQDTTVDSTSSN